jgi:LPXTG-site transpeptidase (sortase) family protein
MVGVVAFAIALAGNLTDGGGGGDPAATAGVRGGETPEGTSPTGMPSRAADYQPYVRPLPLRVIIDRLRVDAPVVEMGMDSRGLPEAPVTSDEVAWYNFSSPVGEGGNAVFAGHINWEGDWAVFAKLDELEPGDNIRLVWSNDREYVYKVVENFQVDPEDPDSLKVMAPTEDDVITLITCGGEWRPDSRSPIGGSYDRRTIIRAEHNRNFSLPQL